MVTGSPGSLEPGDFFMTEKADYGAEDTYGDECGITNCA